MKEYGLFINNQFKSSSKTKEVINPSDGSVIARVSLASESDTCLAVDSARKAFDSGPWSNFSLEKRKEFILKIANGILGKAKELAEIESLNSGKPIKETTFMDIPSSAQTFKHFAENLENYLTDEVVDINSAGFQAQGRLLCQAQGVVGLIVPWNYPLLIASWKMAQALSAGNTIVLKPSSLTPLSVLELGKIIQESGLPEGVVNIIPGEGEEAGKALCLSKNVDMISFTGSNVVGKKILEYSSKHVKKLTMELGGKSAAIVIDDADLELAVNGSLCSIFLNQGQMCTAMSRIFTQENIYNEFKRKFIERTQKIKLGQALDFQTQMGPLISKIQRDNALMFMEKAKAEGLDILSGGVIPEGKELDSGFFFEPTVIEGAGIDSELFKQEIFAPVALLNKFSKIEEAVSVANASDYALAGCIWSTDVQKAQTIAQKISAGTIWINTYGMFFNELSYGGFKQSGFGKELGKEGFLEYTRLKNIVTDQTEGAKPLVNYWYGF